MKSRHALFLSLACACAPATALETAQWPPPDSVAQRMKALQETLRDPAASAPQREAAREELAGLLKSPAGQARGRTPDEKPARPARAAIDPVAVTAIPVAPVPPSPGVAKLEVVEPPRASVNPRTGVANPPVGQFTIDPRTGSVLHPTPGGYVDPKTGQFVPR
ncbi:MAG TPA: hypothetical protein VEC19_14405 [Usitatibacter sp.]|nr:hypothetical protein [Usitatibacter sp.]